MGKPTNNLKSGKNYRDRTLGTVYKTVSFRFAKKVYEVLEKTVSGYPHKNMSIMIEEIVGPMNINKTEYRRKRKSEETIKKTFTFSEDFTKKIKETGNASLSVENALKEKLKI